jgi:hypothetical protein
MSTLVLAIKRAIGGCSLAKRKVEYNMTMGMPKPEEIAADEKPEGGATIQTEIMPDVPPKSQAPRVQENRTQLSSATKRPLLTSGENDEKNELFPASTAQEEAMIEQTIALSREKSRSLKKQRKAAAPAILPTTPPRQALKEIDVSLTVLHRHAARVVKVENYLRFVYQSKWLVASVAQFGSIKGKRQAARLAAANNLPDFMRNRVSAAVKNRIYSDTESSGIPNLIKKNELIPSSTSNCQWVRIAADNGAKKSCSELCKKTAFPYDEVEMAHIFGVRAQHLEGMTDKDELPPA